MSVNNKLENILKVLSEFKYVNANLQEENTTMKRSFEDLTHRHENLMSVASDLNQRIKDLKNERSRMLTAIKLICCVRSNSENCVTWQARQKIFLVSLLLTTPFLHAMRFTLSK